MSDIVVTKYLMGDRIPCVSSSITETYEQSRGDEDIERYQEEERHPE